MLVQVGRQPNPLKAPQVHSWVDTPAHSSRSGGKQKKSRKNCLQLHAGYNLLLQVHCTLSGVDHNEVDGHVNEQLEPQL